jgi:ABC-type transport system involved in cytochrome bd biosynthesis fused ATPase/permease subunit
VLYFQTLKVFLYFNELSFGKELFMKLAVSGKGGVGKTTFSALLIRTLDAQGKTRTGD